MNKTGLKVLIVDDDPLFVMMNKRWVTSTNIADNPATFQNGKLVVEAMSSLNNSDDYFLLFLDINMPLMDGWDVLNAIQSIPLSNKIYVVMVSSSIDTDDKVKATKYPQVIGFYEKILTKNSCEEIKTIPSIAHFYN
jgi:CheY-like chemotaxis protein